MGLGIHPFEKKYLAQFENKVDENGNVSLEPGFILSYQWFTSETKTGFVLSQSLFTDPAGLGSGYTGLSFQKKFYHRWKNSWYISVGPVVKYRESWEDRLNIVESGWYKDGSWEFKIGLLAKVEYNFFFGKRSDLVVSFMYGHQRETFTFALGYKLWLSTKIKHPKDCDCGNKYQKKFKDWFR
jgi:hypothetical protein